MGKKIIKKLGDIVIPHHDRHDHLKNCLDSFDNTLFNIIIVSGATFAQNCNKGAKLAETNKLIFLNDDTLPSTEHLKAICDNLGRFHFVGSTQITGKGVKYYGLGINATNDKFVVSVQLKNNRSLLPSGFCFGFRKNEWESLGGFNESFKNGDEDVDLGFRAKDKGLKINILDLEIKHLESQSIDRFKFIAENEDLFYSIYNQEYLKNQYEHSTRL